MKTITKAHYKFINTIISYLFKTFLFTMIVVVTSGCSTIERIADYNLDRLYEDKEVVVDNTIYLPESTYIKDTIEMVMLNPNSLNPLDSNNYTIDQVLKLIYEPIFDLTSDYDLKPNIIENYIKVAERKYRFTLKNKSFHNNNPLTTEDILFSYEYIKSAESSTYDYCIEYIESITIIDEHIFDVQFNSLNYYNLYALTFPIISKEYVDSKDYNKMLPIGTGKYQFLDFQEMMYLKLNGNKNHKTPPITNNLNINIVRDFEDEYNMFLSKRIDIHSPLKTNWAKYSDDQLIKQYLYDSPYYYYIGINHNNTFLQDITYRKLLATSIPYDKIVQDGFLGHMNQITLPIVSNHIFANEMDPFYANDYSYYKNNYDKKMRSDYLTKLRLDYQFFDLETQTLEMIYNQKDVYQTNIALTISESYDDHNILIKLIPLDSAEYFNAIKAGQFDLYIGSIKTGLIPDFESLYSSNGSLNFGKFNSLNVDGLLNTYYKVMQPTQFYKLLENISKVVTDELPIIPLGFLENGLFIHNQINGDANPTYFNQFYEFDEIDVFE